jgi:hypothetical protein
MGNGRIIIHSQDLILLQKKEKIDKWTATGWRRRYQRYGSGIINQSIWMEWADGIIKSSLYTKSYQSIKQTLPTGLWKTHERKKSTTRKNRVTCTQGGGN